MKYTARIPIKYLDDRGREKIIASGRPVPADLVDDNLVASGSVEVLEGDQEEEVVPDKPLVRMNRAELDAIVADEDVEIGEAKTDLEIVAAIQAKRSAQG